MSAETFDSSADRWVFRALLILVAWLPWPWGSHTPAASAALGVAVGLLALGWLALWMRARVSTPVITRAGRTALALGALWLLWIAFQVCPLPPAVLAVLSPAAAADHGAYAALGSGPAFNTLSVSPAQTVSHLILSISYFTLYALVLVLAQSEPRRRLILLVLVVSGLAQALFAILMDLSGLDYGFFEPHPNSSGRAAGTFINPNHLAAYLEIAIACGVAIVLADLVPGSRGDWRLILRAWIDTAFSTKMRVRVFLAVMVVALVMTRSRGGNTAFFVALTVCGAVFALLRHRRWLGRTLILLLSLLLIDVLIVSRWFGLEEVAQRLEQTDVEHERRFVVFDELKPVIEEYWRTGSGLGTFGVAYAPHQVHPSRTRFDHAHNDYAQFLIETGVVGTVILGLLLAVHLQHALRIIVRRTNPGNAAIGFAGLMSAVAIGVHSTVEFNLQIPAVAATLLVIQGVVGATRSRSGRQKMTSRTKSTDAVQAIG